MKDKLWVFSIQDNVCGGLVRADSEDEAREKLSKQRCIDMDSGTTLIYQISKEMFDDFGVLDLW